jgi:hypothetical protein
MRTIAIGLLALALADGVASAQTAGEKARILRDFQQRVSDYTQRQQCLDLFPEATIAAVGNPGQAPRIFTLPVAMVFRQLIAGAVAERGGAETVHDFTPVLAEALPPLPPPLEYRLVGHDLVIRDTEANISIGAVRDAIGSPLTVIR